MSIFTWAEKKVKSFTIFDFAVLKVCLLSIGIIIGAYVSVFVKQYIIVFAVIAVLSYAWILYRMLKPDSE